MVSLFQLGILQVDDFLSKNRNSFCFLQKNCFSSRKNYCSSRLKFGGNWTAQRVVNGLYTFVGSASDDRELAPRLSVKWQSDERHSALWRWTKWYSAEWHSAELYLAEWQTVERHLAQWHWASWYSAYWHSTEWHSGASRYSLWHPSKWYPI